jgi:Flp pilus assembly protein TadG
MAFLRKLVRGAQVYQQSRGGNIAVVTALLGLPLLMIAGYALDYNRSYSYDDGLASAIDTAALASVIPANLTDIEREAFAQEVFDKNYMDGLPVKLDITATRERVDITAKASVDTMFGGIIGKDTIGISESTAAVLTTSDVVCVLALDTVGTDAIIFEGNSTFKAPNCSIQSNSVSSRALYAKSKSIPVAKSFCTYGGYSGTFSPESRAHCTPIGDPYANVPVPISGSCDANNLAISAGTVTLNPGTYCGGISITEATVNFAPGTYIIENGPLLLLTNSVTKGTGVTFVFKGVGTFLQTIAASKIDLTAPDSGTYKGLVFFQDPDASKYETNRLNGGAYVRFVGTLYFPTQNIVLGGNGDIGSLSPATAYIAHRIQIGQSSQVEVHVNHEEGGVPPLLPRSDEGARLVK